MKKFYNKYIFAVIFDLFGLFCSLSLIFKAAGNIGKLGWVTSSVCIINYTLQDLLKYFDRLNSIKEN